MNSCSCLGEIALATGESGLAGEGILGATGDLFGPRLDDLEIMGELGRVMNPVMVGGTGVLDGRCSKSTDGTGNGGGGRLLGPFGRSTAMPLEG
jgi:hypothetical protein